MDVCKPLIVSPIVIEGRLVRLEPLTLNHLDALCEAGLYPELWRWIPSAVKDKDDMRAYIKKALQWQREGRALPFAVVDLNSGKTVGCTRYANIDCQHKRLEIGWTWISARWQRTGINTEMKFLLLRHAFETLGCLRVELKTDALNERSRAAILRLGAKQEGIFRSHMIAQNGRVRDTVYFSIVSSEWADVKHRFETELLAAR